MVLLLQALGLRGVLDLLGVRHTTVGSVDTLPPSREQPMAAFNTLHRSADSHMIMYKFVLRFNVQRNTKFKSSSTNQAVSP